MPVQRESSTVNVNQVVVPFFELIQKMPYSRAVPLWMRGPPALQAPERREPPDSRDNVLISQPPTTGQFCPGPPDQRPALRRRGVPAVDSQWVGILPGHQLGSVTAATAVIGKQSRAGAWQKHSAKHPEEIASETVRENAFSRKN